MIGQAHVHDPWGVIYNLEQSLAFVLTIGCVIVLHIDWPLFLWGDPEPFHA